MKTNINRNAKNGFALLTLLTLLFGCSSSFEQSSSTTNVISKKQVDVEEIQVRPLVSAKWLDSHKDDTNVVILDTSIKVSLVDGKYLSSSARKSYEKSRIPNARYANLKGGLSKRDTSKDFILPSIRDFQTAMRELGVNNNSHVILYSKDNQSWPARVWWMLKWAGFERASILNGGFRAWQEKKLETESGLAKDVKIGNVDFVQVNNLVAYEAEVKNAISDKSVTIIDSLMPVHYKGGFSLYSRAGHISSAINLPSSNFIDESGYFKSVDELELTLEGDRNARQITYCGGGVAASMVAFNLHRTGFKNVAVYMGSLQEWTESEDNPMTLGEQP